MKKIFFVLAVLMLNLVSFSQAKWDSTFRPNGYALRVEMFRSFPDSKKDIIFLGNSITAGTDWMELLGRNDVRNRGISGDITYGVLERLDEITAGRPAKLFILIGINDIARNIPDSLIVDNYRKIIRRTKKESPSTKIYFQTLLPVNNEITPSKNHYNKDEHILFVNEAIRKMAVEEKITVVDLYPHFLDEHKKLDKKYTADGLHLNAAGYKVWALLLKKGKYLEK